MDKSIEDFLNFLQNEKRLSKNTIDSYNRDLILFQKYLEENELDFNELETDDIKEYISQFQESGDKKPSTISRYLASIRSFYEYLIRIRVREDNPAESVEGPKIEKREPATLTFKEVTLLLEQPKDVDLKGIRDKAMLEFAYATGMRVSELINLNIDDIDLENGFANVHDLKKQRSIPLGQMSLKALADYITNARSVLARPNEKALFVNINGKRLTRQGFWKIIKFYKEQANIEKDITPHVLRHSFASHLLQNGADIKAIQTMLGHSDIASTQVYAKFQDAPLKRIYDDTHPRA